MKKPLFLFVGTSLLWAYSLASGHADDLSDTLKTTLFKPYRNPAARVATDPNLSQTPGAFLVTPDLATIRLLERYPRSRYISVALPISDLRTLPLLIHEIAVVAPDFGVATASGKQVPLPALKFYAGHVVGDKASTVALSVSALGIEGLIFGKDYSYTVGKIRTTTSESLHVVYPTHKIPAQSEFTCAPVEVPFPDPDDLRQEATSRRMLSSDCRGVTLYLEVDHQLYLDWGSDASSITAKVLATLANVVILFQNEGVELEVSELKIWDIPDPYEQAGTPSEILFQFKNYWNARGNAFNGDIAHLLSTHVSRGGLAYYGISRRTTIATLNDISAVFSNPASRSFAFSLSTGVHDSPTRTLPDYSYNVYLIAHELGHNFGLPHTQSCLWEGGPLDDCSSVEDGTCPPGPHPPDGGTLMSYCPNLANGFGPQPRAKMLYELLVAQNLGHPGVPSLQVIPAEVTANQGQYTHLELSNCPGTVLWSDGVFSGNTRTLLPQVSTTYYAACQTDGCLSAAAPVSVTTVCVKESACTISASGSLSLLYGIAEFSFGTLWSSDPNAVPANLGTVYEDFTCTLQTVLKAGESYPFTLSGTLGNSLFAKIYMDYNGNGQFNEANELVYNGLSLLQHSGSITVPTTALRNTPLRMRVMLNPLLILNACSLPSNFLFKAGKVNDYTVTITDGSCPPNYRETVKSGYWDDPLIWSCGTLPTAVDEVKINPGHYITLPGNYTSLTRGLDLQGTIQPAINSWLHVEYP
ncbi:M12 family metallo-peptidase [Salmonirosea aquatica]|uniref:Peptidase M12B domain-containing protein n=1 Tax=Salmonirosea aquatica TaxID=2654236 RepID=A0A7C9BEG2_9BACT|nr:hypothetical protein [Cytophagaceae bacterium SJW1-29]